MKLNAVLLRYSLILFCFSCSSEKGNQANNTNSSEITAVNLIDNLSNTTEAFLLSEISDQVEAVQLEIDPNHLFDEEDIENLQIGENYLFFYTGRSGILQYNRSGKFIRQIGRIGRGPGEYILLRSYAVDQGSQTIMGYSNWSHSLLFHDFEGNFKKAVNPLYMGSSDYPSIHLFGKYYLIEQNPFFGPGIIDTSLVYNLAITDSAFHEVKILTDPTYKNRKAEIVANRYDPYDSWANFYQGPPPVKKIRSDHLDFIYYGGDTIYRIGTDLQVKPRYVIDTGKKMPFDILHYRCHPLEYFDYLLIRNFHETPEYVFFDLGYKKRQYKARFRKSDGYTDMLANDATINDIHLSGHLYSRRREGPVPFFTNDLNGSGAFNPQWTDEKHWICAYPAYKLMSMNLDSLRQTAVKFPAARDQFVNLIENMKETDGPVLMIVHLKGTQDEK